MSNKKGSSIFTSYATTWILLFAMAFIILSNTVVPYFYTEWQNRVDINNTVRNERG